MIPPPTNSSPIFAYRRESCGDEPAMSPRGHDLVHAGSARRNARDGGFDDSRLARFLADAAQHECRVCLWYAGDYVDLPRFTTSRAFLDAVAAGVRSLSVEIYATLDAA